MNDVAMESPDNCCISDCTTIDLRVAIRGFGKKDEQLMHD